MARGNWKTGARSGYADYRYGRKSGSRVKMPSILGDGQRQRITAQTAKVLTAWSFSPFEHEGSCRHGLRSAMCMDGHHWDDADYEAAQIVSGALAIVGARRPTWEQGQREYVIPAENCNWCNQPLDGSHLRARFCTPECGKAAWEHRSYERTAKDDAVRLAAYAMIRKGRTKPRQCAHCGDSFQPLKAHSTQKFCSRRCQYDYAAITPQFPRVCDCCGRSYLARSNRGRFCSPTCRTVTVQLERGSILGLSPDRFDHFFLPKNKAPA